jgi:uncharacterized protein YdaU (DUF1376 family)
LDVAHGDALTGGMPMLPLFPDSFLGATTGWELDEVGLYLNLLCAQWLTGTLPSDPEKLAVRGRCTLSAFNRAWPKVGPKFVKVDGGLENVRLEEHRASSLNRKERASAGGHGAARKRAQSVLKPVLNGALNGAHPTPTPTLDPKPSPTPSKDKRKPRTEYAPEFQMFQSIYPKRLGDQGWADAARRCNARLAEGHKWQEILDGAQRYADQQRALDKIGTPYVKKAETFVGPDKHFLEAHPQPANRAERNQDDNINVSQAFLQRKLGEQRHG